MHYEEALPAEKAKGLSPQERMSDLVMVQHDLMARDPSPSAAEDWVGRYAKTFRELFDTDADSSFREIVHDAHMADTPTEKNRLLTLIQERLDDTLINGAH